MMHILEANVEPASILFPKFYGLKRLSGYLHPSTFIFPLGRICNAIEKDTLTEEPISPKARLAIFFVSSCNRRLLFNCSRDGRNRRADIRIHRQRGDKRSCGLFMGTHADWKS